MPASLDLKGFPGCQLQLAFQNAYRNGHRKGPLLLKQEKLDQ